MLGLYLNQIIPINAKDYNSTTPYMASSLTYYDEPISKLTGLLFSNRWRSKL